MNSVLLQFIKIKKTPNVLTPGSFFNINNQAANACGSGKVIVITGLGNVCVSAH